MPTRKADSVTTEIMNSFWEQVINTSTDPIPEEEINERLMAWLDYTGRKADWDAAASRALCASKVHGQLMRRTKHVKPDESEGQFDLFPETYREHGISTPDGFISNLNATYQHRVFLEEQCRRRVERANEELRIELMRNSVLEPAFNAGAGTVGEALEVVYSEPAWQASSARNTGDSKTRQK